MPVPSSTPSSPTWLEAPWADRLNPAASATQQRPVVDAGWASAERQVGQTGTKVAPDLYIACGISGATQHIAGCRNSKTMIVINTDPEAAIMGYADYAIIGDVSKVLPAIVEETRKAKAG